MDSDSDKKIAQLYQTGLSAQQVSEQLHISCAKVRYSLEKQLIPMRCRSDAIKMLHATKFGKQPYCIKTNRNEQEEHLRIAGTMLYWGEGTKSGNSVVFSNSDPGMVTTFLRFLREICGIDNTRLRLLLHRYPDQDEEWLKKFWSNSTSIPINQFSKTCVHPRKNGTYKKLSNYGTVSLRYSDKSLLQTINKWIEEYQAPR